MYLDKLIKKRAMFIETIAKSADEIKNIDEQLAVIRSQELEVDLNQAAEAACEEEKVGCRAERIC